MSTPAKIAKVAWKKPNLTNEVCRDVYEFFNAAMLRWNSSMQCIQPCNKAFLYLQEDCDLYLTRGRAVGCKCLSRKAGWDQPLAMKAIPL